MREYTEKELTIFGGVLRLAQEGISLQDMTAKQIAEAAGVGKATIYDYFSSKEEILVQALIYTLRIQNEKTSAALEKLTTYRDKMMYLYNGLIDTTENSFSIFNIVTSMGGPEKAHTYFRQTDSCSLMGEAVEEVMDTFRKVTVFGMETGAITETDRKYITMTVTSTMFAVGKFRSEKTLPREEICSNAYKMLIKALN